MKKYLTVEEFEALKARIARGTSGLQISRRVSRQFFTRVNNASIVETTGRSMLAQKLIVWSGVLASPALLLLAIAAIVFHFGWISAIAVPLVGTFWTVIAGFTGDKGTWWHGLIGLIAGLGLSAFIEPAYGIPLALFTVSLWIHRSNYRLAQIWLTQLITTSFGAFDMLVEHIDIRDALLESQGTAEQS